MSIWKGTFSSNIYDGIHGTIKIYIPKYKKKRYIVLTTVEFTYMGDHNYRKKILFPIKAFYSLADKQYTRFESTNILIENHVVLVFEIITKYSIYGNYKLSDMFDNGEINFSKRNNSNKSSCSII